MIDQVPLCVSLLQVVLCGYSASGCVLLFVANLNGSFSFIGIWRHGKAPNHFCYSSSVVAMDAGSWQPANGGREGMVLQHVLLVASLVSLQPPRTLEGVAKPHLQQGSGCWPKARIAVVPLFLHALPFSCPVWLVGADTSSGSVCVARSQLSPALLNRFASPVIQIFGHWIKEFYSMQLLSQGKKRWCALGLCYKLSITISHSTKSCFQTIL